MKALIFLLFLAPFAVSAQTGLTPVQYNDKIVDYQNEIGYALVAMIDYIGAEDSQLAAAEALRLEVLKKTKASIAGLEKMTAYEGNDVLRKAALDLFRFYLRVVEVDYKKIIDIVYKEDITEADATALSELVVKIEDEEGKYDSTFEKAQLAFATTHNLELEENELQELIDEE